MLINILQGNMASLREGWTRNLLDDVTHKLMVAQVSSQILWACDTFNCWNRDGGNCSFKTVIGYDSIVLWQQLTATVTPLPCDWKGPPSPPVSARSYTSPSSSPGCSEAWWEAACYLRSPESLADDAAEVKKMYNVVVLSMHELI